MGITKVSALRLSAATGLLAGSLLLAVPGVGANADPTPRKPVACDGVNRGTVVIDGGSVTNTTDIDVSADGGTGIGDASGGDDNLALTGGGRDDGDRDGRRGRFDDDTELAAAGNGGVAGAAANGGAVDIERVNSGGNAGNAIAVGDTIGNGGCAPAVNITGGIVTNTTTIDVSADGGTAIADASGGDGNVAITSANGRANAGNGGTVSAGNGGVANASADGGAISIGEINSGGNVGNAISVGDTIQGPAPVCCAPKPVPGKPGAPKPGIKKIDVTPGRAEKARPVVAEVPSTGIGMVAGAAGGTEAALLLAGSLLSVGAIGAGARRRFR